MPLQKHQRDKLIAAGRELIGVKWKHMGRDKLGVDCIGLVVHAGKAVNVWPQDWNTEPYRLSPDLRKMMTHLKAVATRTVDPKAGDVVLFFRKNLVHVGLITYEHHILHANQQHGFVTEVPFTEPWCSYPSSYWEFK